MEKVRLEIRAMRGGGGVAMSPHPPGLEPRSCVAYEHVCILHCPPGLALMAETMLFGSAFLST